MKYKIAIQKSDEGYSVSVPELPGCWSQGATEQEALDNIHDAIREHLTAADAGPPMKYDNVKPSRHFIKNQESKNDRRDITIEVAETIVQSPEKIEPGRKGRVEYLAQPSGFSHLIKVVVSAAVSATESGQARVARIVTAHKIRRRR